MGFLDAAALRTGTLPSASTLGYLVPPAGPPAGGTSVMWTDYAETTALSSVFFGANMATGVSAASSGLFAVTPAGSAGPVDVVSNFADGGQQTLPEGFSYGPTILQATPDRSTVEGGGAGVLFGYGFGSPAVSAVPSDLQLTIGGHAAQITGFIGNAYTSPAPFQLEAITYTVPAGSLGASDIVLTNTSGTTTLSAGMGYLPATQQFPLPNAALAQGVYDPVRDLYYFTDTSQIEVFSRTQGKWLTPIQVPAAPSGQSHRLWGIALSPNDLLLAVSDASTGQLFILDPSGKNPARTYLFNENLSYDVALPAGIAITDAGVLYFGAFHNNSVDLPSVYEFDPGSSTLTPLIAGSGGSPQERVLLSSDNSRLYIDDGGGLESIDTASGLIDYANYGQCCYGDFELTLSSNQISLEGSEYLLDTDMHLASYYSYNLRESANISFVYGAKLSPDGSLLFQPGTNSIDIVDGRLGNLLHRIALPFALSQNFDALVSDGLDNDLIAITGQAGSGIALIDFTSVPEPPPLGYAVKIAARRDVSKRPPVARVARGAVPPMAKTWIRHKTNASVLPQ